MKTLIVILFFILCSTIGAGYLMKPHAHVSHIFEYGSENYTVFKIYHNGDELVVTYRRVE